MPQDDGISVVPDVCCSGKREERLLPKFALCQQGTRGNLEWGCKIKNNSAHIGSCYKQLAVISKHQVSPGGQHYTGTSFASHLSLFQEAFSWRFSFWCSSPLWCKSQLWLQYHLSAEEMKWGKAELTAGLVSMDTIGWLQAAGSPLSTD